MFNRDSKSKSLIVQLAVNWDHTEMQVRGGGRCVWTTFK